MMTMTNSPPIFVDTSGWAALLNQGDSHHPQAGQLFREIFSQNRELITTNYILLELLSLMATRSKGSRQFVITQIYKIHKFSLLEVIHIDHQQDLSAWEMARQYLDKDWSLVDMASFVIMRELGIYEALTTDHHFEQAGFIRLLK
jgi:predicted nucleic acid-binding protein